MNVIFELDAEAGVELLAPGIEVRQRTIKASVYELRHVAKLIGESVHSQDRSLGLNGFAFPARV